MPTPGHLSAGPPLLPSCNWVKTKPRLAGNKIPLGEQDLVLCRCLHILEGD